MSDEVRFMAKVDQTGACWLWTGAKDRDGYGQFKVGGRRGQAVGAHRWAYLHWIGPIEDGLKLDHLCRVPCCVNPVHLEPVTNRENICRGLSSSPITCRNGHFRTPENTLIRPDGTRYCRECCRIRDRNSRLDPRIVRDQGQGEGGS